MKILLAKTDHKHGTSKVIASTHSLRQALALMEEIIWETCEHVQGDLPATWLDTTIVGNTGYEYRESWFSSRPYGFFVQKHFPEWWLGVTLFVRKRSVGMFYNSYEDKKLFTLQVIEFHGPQDAECPLCLMRDDVLLLAPLPFLGELRDKVADVDDVTKKYIGALDDEVPRMSWDPAK